MRDKNIYACDFETTVTGNEDQDHTEVWSAGICKLHTEDIHIFNNIKDFFLWIFSQKSNCTLYFHNLKFDGSFILDWLYNEGFVNACHCYPDGRIEWIKDRFMPSKSVKYVISDMGAWYTITIRWKGITVEIRDSLKLLPFSLKEIGKAFQTKHQKLEMEYEGDRHAYGDITDQEREYLANDVFVLKEGLEFMFSEGLDRLTIGSCCMHEYKEVADTFDYDQFVNMGEIELDKDIYGATNADQYIRKAYRGGWCYLNPHFTETVVHDGLTADVNSLYPSVMHSESGCDYPIGSPTFWSGDYIPDTAYKDGYTFFVRLRTRFQLKKGYLPFIQIKGNLLYKGTENLVTSDIKGDDGYYYDHYIRDGKTYPAIVTMTLTKMDYELLKEHYDLYDTEILDGCIFVSRVGLFDRYIDKWRAVKERSKGAKRTLAKLMLNNLYGRLAINDDSTFKIADLGEDKVLHFKMIEAHDKKLFYIPAGAFVTSHARNFTIRTAQKNYYENEDHGFIYADTDSIHCRLTPDDLIDVPVHPTAFCHWKLESFWDKAIFVRQKTYIEHVTHEDGKKVDSPYNLIKCAGLPKNCKALLDISLTGATYTGGDERERAFCEKKRELSDFKRGIVIPSKLMAHRVRGGIVLVKTDFELRY